MGAVTDVLLGVQEDNGGQDIHYLFADTDKELADGHSGMVDKLGQAKLEDLSKKNPWSLGPGCNPVHLALIQHLDADKSLQQCLPSNGSSHQQLLGSLMILARVMLILQSSHLFQNPYLTISFSSWSRWDLKGLCGNHLGFATNLALSHLCVGFTILSAPKHRLQ